MHHSTQPCDTSRKFVYIFLERIRQQFRFRLLTPKKSPQNLRLLFPIDHHRIVVISPTENISFLYLTMVDISTWIDENSFSVFQYLKTQCIRMSMSGNSAKSQCRMVDTYQYTSIATSQKRVTTFTKATASRIVIYRQRFYPVNRLRTKPPTYIFGHLFKTMIAHP